MATSIVLLLACRYADYIPTEQRLWKEAAELLDFSELKQIPEEEARGFPFAERLGASRAFRQLAALRLSDPFRLPPGWIWDTLAFIGSHIDRIRLEPGDRPPDQLAPGCFPLCRDCEPNEKLKNAGIAYILQDNSVFPDMTVEENLWMGGWLLNDSGEAKCRAEEVFAKYPRLARRRKQPASVLSGGERRLLEIARALIMRPEVLLVDEPSIGLEPRFIDMVFEILDDLQHAEGKTIIMVEQNARKGLEFADIGYVLVSGQLVKADSGDALLDDPDVGRLFLGG